MKKLSSESLNELVLLMNACSELMKGIPAFVDRRFEISPTVIN